MENSTLILIQTAAITIGVVSIVLIWFMYLSNLAKEIRRNKCKHISWSQYTDEKGTRRHCLDCEKKLEPKNKNNYELERTKRFLQ